MKNILLVVAVLYALLAALTFLFLLMVTGPDQSLGSLVRMTGFALIAPPILTVEAIGTALQQLWEIIEFLFG